MAPAPRAATGASCVLAMLVVQRALAQGNGPFSALRDGDLELRGFQRYDSGTVHVYKPSPDAHSPDDRWRAVCDDGLTTTEAQQAFGRVSGARPRPRIVFAGERGTRFEWRPRPRARARLAIGPARLGREAAAAQRLGPLPSMSPAVRVSICGA